MSKAFRTKKKILKALSTGSKTTTRIAHELELAPSTVSQHIAELAEMGAIERVDNPFVIKFKYYRIAPGYSYALPFKLARKAVMNNVMSATY